MGRTLGIAAALAVACAGGAGAQEGAPAPALRVEPFVAYGFYGSLPDDGPELRGDVGLGVRAAYAVTPRLALFGAFQRTTPELEDAGDVEVDHWSAGAEVAFLPRGAADGVPPLLLEAGVGQARYRFGGLLAGEDDFADLALHLGVASTVRLSRRLALRYGVRDYLSDFGDDGGVVNHFFAHAGAELRF
jgi:hypothetical protein